MVTFPEFGLSLLEWITISAGKVTLEKGWVGSKYSTDPMGTFPVDAFAISKYPITNAHYQAFISDGGYKNDQWWQGLAKRYAMPAEPAWATEDYPRESVSWYEAIAFCRWLSSKLGQTVTLPTEMQWQRAAQGDDGREYPWGNGFDRAKCNTAESGIGQTTPVDRYPNGQSPFGVFDMAGNVWEWCLNEYSNPLTTDISGTMDRVLRGGSWHGYLNVARTAYRYYFGLPDDEGSIFGFRVAVSTPSQ